MTINDPPWLEELERLRQENERRRIKDACTLVDDRDEPIDEETEDEEDDSDLDD